MVMGATTPGNSTILRTAMTIVASSGIRMVLAPGAPAALVSLSGMDLSRFCQAEDDASIHGVAADRVASRRQTDAPLEASLRQFKPVNMRVAQLRRQRSIAADDEDAPVDHGLDLVGVNAGQGDEDQ